MKRTLVVIVICFFSPIVWFTSSCTPSNGSTATDLIIEKVVVLRDGYDGYDGTRDTTIGVTPADITSTLISSGNPATEQSAGARFVASDSPAIRALGLISFDVSGAISGMLKSGEVCAEEIEVLRAELDIFSQIVNMGYVTLVPLKSTAPAWTEEDANFTAASLSENWTTGGTYPNTPVLNDTRLGYFDAEDGVPNSAISRNVNFKIPTDSVQEWICDSSKNKGLLFRYNIGSTGFAKFFTREFPDKTFRPMLTIYLKRKN